jgi:hypothetical protein
MAVITMETVKMRMTVMMMPVMALVAATTAATAMEAQASHPA